MGTWVEKSLIGVSWGPYPRPYAQEYPCSSVYMGISVDIRRLYYGVILLCQERMAKGGVL